jgi:DNA polymerase I-like protein with 3'-5' exonuclease and polymerase domains
MFQSLQGQGMIAIDLETFDPDLKENGPGYHRNGFIAGVAIGTESGIREYYPIAHEGGGNLDKEKVLSYLKKELLSDVPKVGANILYDMGFLKCAGVEVGGPWYDIQIAEPLLDENKLSYSLESIAWDYLGEGKVTTDLDKFLVDNFGKKNPKSNIWRAPGDIVRPYAIGDVDLPLRIFKIQMQKLAEQSLLDLFMLETKLLPMLLAMRLRGIKVDIQKAEEIYEHLGKEIADKEEEVARIVGRPLSIWAAADIAHAFDQFSLPYPLTDKTRKPSITASLLERTGHPLSQLIVEIRKADKFRETFLLGSILEKHHNGRIHSQFNPLKSDAGGTVSGRFSSSSPNLQFIPTRTDMGKQIRSLFIPDEGCDLYAVDYSQIEYRLLAHFAAMYKLPGSSSVVEKYAEDSGVDFHQIVADMTGLSRTSAKTVNFGLAYGQGAASLTEQLGIERLAADQLLNEYHKRAPFIRALSQKLQMQATQYGLVTTLLGRKRRFESWVVMGKDGTPTILKKRIYGAKRAFTHKALNALVQGSAADIMKKAMLDIWESGVIDVLGVPQLTVHDELVGSSPQNKKGQEAIKEMISIMENCVSLCVPLRVEGGRGPNWSAAK